MEEKDDGSREVKTIFGAPIAIACCGDLSDAIFVLLTKNAEEVAKRGRSPRASQVNRSVIELGIKVGELAKIFQQLNEPDFKPKKCLLALTPITKSYEEDKNE